MIPYPLIFILLATAILSIGLGKLNTAGGITGVLAGICIFNGAGYTGIMMTGTFFLTGTLATSWKLSSKENLGIAEKNKGRRNARQVMANAGVATLLGVITWIDPSHKNLFGIMIAASIAAATSDTLSSELGNVYGRRFYNCITFKKDIRGMNGVVSLEGSLFGIIGSAMIGLIYAISFGWSKTVLWIVIAGIAGNFIDSVLGATLERSNYLSNNAVNFVNTFSAALVVLFLVLVSQ